MDHDQLFPGARMKSLYLAVIGLGRWGPNHIRNFAALPDATVVAACDPAPAARERAASLLRDGKFYAEVEPVLRRPDVEAVVVATPTNTHYRVVRDALEAGKHVLCEKPLAASSREAWELAKLADDRKLVLMVGHVFLYNAGLEAVFQAVRDQIAGGLYYLSAVRTNLGPFRYDVNAGWDLASHDIYIFNHLLGARPTWVSAVGGSYLNRPVEDIVFITLQYPSGVLGHIHVSWLDPKKVRTLTAVGEKKMITWDEFGVPGPVMIYDRTVAREPRYDTFGEFQLLAREGDVVVPRVRMQEPLAAQARAFVGRCRGATDDLRGHARQGAEAVDVLEAMARSLREDGRRVEIVYGD
jgi:predicted dehydrogenase